MRLPRWVVIVLALVLVGAGTGAVLLFTGGEDHKGARDEVRAFLDAWGDKKDAQAARRTDNPKAAADLLESVRRNLAPEKAEFELSGDARELKGGAVAVPYRADLELDTIGPWEYAGEAVAEPRGDGWRVRWEPRLLHPKLKAHQTLVLSKKRAERAPILGSGGAPLAADGKVWEVGIWPARLSDPDEAYEALDDLDAGIDIPELKKRVKAGKEKNPDRSIPVVTLRDAAYQKAKGRLLDISGLQFRDAKQPVAYRARALVGSVTPGSDKGASGLQARYDKQLRAAPAAQVVIADRDTGQPKRTLAKRAAGHGKPVRTTIDPALQAAAEGAVGKVKKSASLVAVRPTDGRILAVADNSGAERALSGRYPPGSTFKVVTTAALLDKGVRGGTRVDCPKYERVAGQRFENQDEFDLPKGTTFEQSFAKSCNTAFIGLRDKLGDGSLTDAAKAFGIGGEWQVGATTFDGSVPAPKSENEKAASMIGQGRVEASPLVMASVAATVKEGGFHQPVLVPDAAKKRYQAPANLDGKRADELRTLMRKVVTDGSGWALKGLPGQPHAKSGTAEFGTAKPPKTHAWMIGFLGDQDLAFAVLIEDGGSGGKDAGPVLADFLKRTS
ncbi:penicillin-binding transpeptidase domain-containing protein [Streptomyces boninensis]|uniref:penicillin-binding transpeptidase domain-containing protein n=1 Tax=Streptomyces boninensis TaxID=2039455 RepID=UPI003B21E1F5